MIYGLLGFIIVTVFKSHKSKLPCRVVVHCSLSQSMLMSQKLSDNGWCLQEVYQIDGRKSKGFPFFSNKYFKNAFDSP